MPGGCRYFSPFRTDVGRQYHEAHRRIESHHSYLMDKAHSKCQEGLEQILARSHPALVQVYAAHEMASDDSAPAPPTQELPRRRPTIASMLREGQFSLDEWFQACKREIRERDAYWKAQCSSGARDGAEERYAREVKRLKRKWSGVIQAHADVERERRLKLGDLERRREAELRRLVSAHRAALASCLPAPDRARHRVCIVYEAGKQQAVIDRWTASTLKDKVRSLKRRMRKAFTLTQADAAAKPKSPRFGLFIEGGPQMIDSLPLNSYDLACISRIFFKRLLGQARKAKEDESSLSPASPGGGERLRLPAEEMWRLFRVDTGELPLAPKPKLQRSRTA